MAVEDQFLGDTSVASGIRVPVCGECGRDMVPRVFFGHIFGWSCGHSDPEPKCWSASRG